VCTVWYTLRMTERKTGTSEDVCVNIFFRMFLILFWRSLDRRIILIKRE